MSIRRVVGSPSPGERGKEEGEGKGEMEGSMYIYIRTERFFPFLYS
jgi:hypothetical protein